MIMCTNQTSMSVMKEHMIVYKKRTENVAIQLDDLTAFVLMVTWRMLLEYALVRVNNQEYNSCNVINVALLDIDECLMETDLCEQSCSNTPGSYVCSCRDGYSQIGFNCMGMSSCENG